MRDISYKTVKDQVNDLIEYLDYASEDCGESLYVEIVGQESENKKTFSLDNLIRSSFDEILQCDEAYMNFKKDRKPKIGVPPSSYEWEFLFPFKDKKLRMRKVFSPYDGFSYQVHLSDLPVFIEYLEKEF